MKLLWRQRLKLVCPALRSYHLKTLFLHYLETADSAALEEARLQTIFQSLLLFIQRRLEEGSIPHYFIPSLNLLQQPSQQEDRKTEKKLETCLEVIRDFQQRDVQDVFSDNTKNTLLLQEFKRNHPLLNIVVIFLLLLLNALAVCAGAVIYLAIFSSVLAVILSVLYASIVSVPIILVTILVYSQLSKGSRCRPKEPPVQGTGQVSGQEHAAV